MKSSNQELLVIHILSSELTPYKLNLLGGLDTFNLKLCANFSLIFDVYFSKLAAYWQKLELAYFMCTGCPHPHGHIFSIE